MTDADLLQFLDVTSLRGTESESELLELAGRVEVADGPPAALCIFPDHLAAVAAAFPDRQWALATVVNFPFGDGDPEAVGHATERAVAAGAQEIDAVIALDAYFKGDLGRVDAVLSAVRSAAPEACVKAILETGDPRYTPRGWGRAADLALESGVNFLKTSTGKVPVGATPAAVERLLDAIGTAEVGVKVSGGIRTREVAVAFADILLRRPAFNPLTPRRFRIGASDLFTLINARART